MWKYYFHTDAFFKENLFYFSQLKWAINSVERRGREEILRLNILIHSSFDKLKISGKIYMVIQKMQDFVLLSKKKEKM